MFLEKKNVLSKYAHLTQFVTLLMLSWLYALCSQIVISLPFGLVPISLQPLPLYVCVMIFGMPAVYAYLLYLLQGVLGAPFFAYGLSGMARLLGPTGGYLLGFGVAMSCIALLARRAATLASQIFVLIIAQAIVYTCGLAQLALFVPPQQLISAGLLPFVLGDMGKLIVAAWFARATRRHTLHTS